MRRRSVPLPSRPPLRSLARTFPVPLRYVYEPVDGKYAAMNTAIPKFTKKPNVLAASAVLKAGNRNRRRSISGSASFLSRRTNATPTR